MTEHAGALHDPARLAALSSTALTASADDTFDRITQMVAKILHVPVALVSIVDDARQFFPGAVGLSAQFQRDRQTDLDHSFCQHVVTSAEPLIVTDARDDPRVKDNLAITDLDVIGYAGIPLTDAEGHVLGSLCAIDNQPREWTAAELEMLTDLAASCAAELQLRIAVRQAEQALTARRQVESGARSLSDAVNAALDRSQLLLQASEALSGTATVTDVVRAVATLVSTGPAPSHVAVMLRDGQSERLDLVAADPLPSDAHQRWRTTLLSSEEPAAVAVRERRAVFLADRTAALAAFPHLAADLEQLGWHTLVCAPLIGTTAVLGTLRLAWDTPFPLETGERAMITTLAAYVSQALERALHLNRRVAVAETLQHAMLPPLRQIEQYELAVRYQPADAGEHVGGDWYDAVIAADGRLALVIGDVSGHDMTAAAKMGQLRSMLRAYLVDRHEPPSALLRRLDAANHALGDHTIATVLVAFVDRTSDGTHHLQWANAGHPPPVLLHADGTVRSLEGRDPLIGAGRLTSRRNYTCPLPPGSTLLLHTDGLVETRHDKSIDDGVRRLHDQLSGLAGVPLDEVLADLVRHGLVTHEDDIALLALRTPG